MQSHAQRLETVVLVGKGFCSDVYAWDTGRILKLFHAWYPRDRVERAYRASRAVHAAGIPTPAAFELLEIDGRRGIVFERVAGVSLVDYTRTRPWAIFAAIRLFAELHRQIHRCQGPAQLPTMRERIAAGIKGAEDVAEAERQTAQRRLAGLPDGTALCHGDFHPGNVLVTSRGPVVIDWGAASRGDPLGDVACTSRLLQTASLPPWSPGYLHLLLRCLRPAIHRSYLKRYLQDNGGTRREIEAWKTPLAVAARSLRIPGPPSS